MSDKMVVGSIVFAPREDKSDILKVFICIRLRPKSKDSLKAKQEFQNNLKRAKIAARYAALNGYDPEATTIYFTQFLDDSLAEERELGMKIGRARLLNCDKLWCVTNSGEMFSSGMKSDIDSATENGILIEYKNFAEMEDWVKNYDAKNKKAPA